MAPEKQPSWLKEGMDPCTSFNLEIRIFSPNSRCRWFSFDMVIDSDTINFKDLVDVMLDKYPCGYGDLVKVFYYCADTKSNIQVQSDQDLLQMFAKNVSTKMCCISLAYYPPNCDQLVIPLWEEDVEVPCTPSMAVPCQVEPSQTTLNGSKDVLKAKSVDNDILNLEPENEHLGDDDDDLGAGQPNVEPSDDLHELSFSDSEYDHDSDSDYEDDEGDEMVQDIVPPHNPEVVYDKDDPPMAVGTIYPGMSEFKLALASHAIKYEFEYTKKGAKKQKTVPQQNTSPTMNTRSKVSTSPSSPATGTRSKRKLNVS